MSKLTMQDVYDIGSHIVSTVNYDIWKKAYLNNEEDGVLDLEVANIIKYNLEIAGIKVDDEDAIKRDFE